MNRLRDLRKDKRLTLVEVAEKTGIAKSTLARMETEDVSIKSDIGKILADFYGVSIGYIMGLENVKVSKNINEIEIAFYNLKGMTPEQMQKVNEYIEFLKSKDDKH